MLQIIFCQSSSTNFFIHDHQQQLHQSSSTNFLIHDHQQQLHQSSSTNFFIHDHQQQLHPSSIKKLFSFMIINNNFIHQKLFIHDHQQQLHSPLPSTYILTGRTHRVVYTTFVGQLVRTMLVHTRTITDTPRRVVNHRTFILHR